MINGNIRILTDEDIVNQSSGTKEVRNRNDYDLKSRWYVRGGLYDPLIFGSVDRCSCGKTTTVGSTCPVCRVKVVTNSEYLNNVGYYHLKTPYVSFIKLPSLLGKLSEAIPGFTARSIDDLWSYRYECRLMKGTSLEDLTEDNLGAGIYLKDAKNNVYKLDINELPGDDVDHPIYEYSLDEFGLLGLLALSTMTVINTSINLKFIESFINYNIVVPSPAVRPLSFYSPSNDSTVIKLPQYTLNLRAIIDYNESIEYLMNEVYESVVDKMTLAWFMNKMVDGLLGMNELLQGSKESLGRNIVSTRLSKSIRSNAIMTYDIPMDHIKIPRTLAYIALQSDVIEGVKEAVPDVIHRDAIKMYVDKDPIAMRVFEDIVSNSLVTMVRNPSLHKFSMQTFHPEIWDEIAVGVNPAICEGYNLDFDGDQVYIQFYTSDLDCARVSTFTPDKLWFYDKTNTPQMVPNNDVLYGLHMATKLIEPDNGLVAYESLDAARKAYESGDIKIGTKCVIDGVTTSYGRAYLSSAMNMDLNGFLGLDTINLSNIAKIISALGSHADRVQEYKSMVDFALEVATSVGMGAIPYADLYKGDANVVKSILEDPNDDAMVKQAKLRQYFNEVVTESVKNLPDSNIDDLMKASKKVGVNSISSIYAPMINGDSEVQVDGSSLASGLSERQYTLSAEAGRSQLKAKRQLVPAAGFDQRQLVNAELKLIYKDVAESPDTTGIILPAWAALGRTDLNGNIIKTISANRNAKVRVKSCVCTDTNIVYKDELGIRLADDMERKYLNATDVPKFSYNNNSAIGVSFAEAITECITQKGLSFKHGGQLLMSAYQGIKSVESGMVTEITDTYVKVVGDNEYLYILTTGCNVAKGITLNAEVPKGKVLIDCNKIIGADDTLIKIDTILDLVVMGDVGQKVYSSNSAYALNSGVLHYYLADGVLSIGDKYYTMDNNDAYFYPDGYEVEIGDRLSTGIPNMSLICKEVEIGMAYYIFFDYMMTLDMFKDFNSEIFETLFKCIYQSGFSVIQSINNKTDLVEKLYYGRGTSNITEAIANSKVDSETNSVIAKLGDSILLPIILSNKR